MKRFGVVLILACLFSGAELFGTEPAASLEVRIKAVAKTFHASYKTKPDKAIAELLTSVEALGQAFQGEKPITDQLDDLLNIRKHLGWTVAIQIQPYATTANKHVDAAFEKLKPLEPRLAKPITLAPLQN